MTVEVRLPQWGMGMLEGYLSSWYKQVGDLVELDEPIAEVEAAKTTSDLCAPIAGRIEQILVEEGETVPVHTVLVLIEEAAVPSLDSPEPPRPEPARPVEAPVDVPAEEQAVVPPEPVHPVTARPQPVAARRQVAPRTRRLARDLGVDLDAVTGSGPGGRVLEADVRGAAVPPGSADDTSAGETPAARTTPTPAPTAAGQVAALGGVRRIIAERMTASLRSTAQFTLTMRADATALIRRRQQLRPVSALTVTDLLIRAVAEVLPRHPVLNAHLTESGLVASSDVNVGLAVALDEGLVVPVVERAQTLTLSEIRDRRRDLVERARAGRLTPGDTGTGTFTLSNLGSTGVEYFTPILNTPEVAILGVGTVSEVPVRFQGRLGWAKAMPLSLTVDHQVVDGQPAAAFLQDLVSVLATPDVLLESPGAGR